MEENSLTMSILHRKTHTDWPGIEPEPTQWGSETQTPK
jgi:hypothetical protein